MNPVSNRDILVAILQTIQAINNVGQGLPKSEDVVAQCLSDLLQIFDVFFYLHASLNGIDHRDSIVSINGSGQVGSYTLPQRKIFVFRHCQAARNLFAGGDQVISALVQCSVKKVACVPPSLSGHNGWKIGDLTFKDLGFVAQRFESSHVLGDYKRQTCKMVTCISDDYQQIEVWINQLVNLKSLFSQAQANQLSMSLLTGGIGPIHRDNSPRSSRNSKNAGYEGLKLRHPVSPSVATGPIRQRRSFTEYRRNNQSHEKYERQKPHHSPNVMSRHVPSKTIEIDLLHLSQIAANSQEAQA